MESDPVRELLRTLPGVVYRCVYDADWTMQLVSDEIEAVTGFPAATFIGNRERSFASVIHPDDRTRIAREIDAQLARRDDFACEYRLIRADGSTVWILERGRRVPTADGSTPLLDGLLFDITERKQAQKELRASVAEQAVTRAVNEERANVARELHDSLGHMLAVVALHAGLAVTQLSGDRAAVAATLGLIREVVKESTNDIGVLLNTLGTAVEDTAAIGLDELPSLVERVRAAGMPVELVVEGDPRPYRADIDHAAYRVVQEGLTNVMKHAPDAPVTIRIGHGSSTVTFEVTNGGYRASAPADRVHPATAARGGRGISGLGSRVRELGGRLTSGPRPDGGFTIKAVMPSDAI